MNDPYITASLTLIGGVLLFSATKVLSDFFLEPLKKRRELLGEIADALIYYANLYANPIPLSRDEPKDSPHKLASDRMRQLSTLLLSRTYMIPAYNFLEQLGLVIPGKEVDQAASQLMLIANSFYLTGSQEGRSPGIDNSEAADKTRRLLRIRKD